MSTVKRIARYRHALLIASRAVRSETLANTLLELRERLRLRTTAEYREAAGGSPAAVDAARGGEG